MNVLDSDATSDYQSRCVHAKRGITSDTRGKANRISRLPIKDQINRYQEANDFLARNKINGLILYQWAMEYGIGDIGWNTFITRIYEGGHMKPIICDKLQEEECDSRINGNWCASPDACDLTDNP